MLNTIKVSRIITILIENGWDVNICPNSVRCFRYRDGSDITRYTDRIPWKQALRETFAELVKSGKITV